jgi:thiol-disulfide isomerase/thioredoxin
VLKKIIIIFFGVFALLNAAQAETVFHDTQGKAATGFKNKWVIVNYWAPWCDVCHEEIPELNRFSANLRSQNVILYGVDIDLPALQPLQIAANQTGVTFPVLTQDPGDEWKLGEVDVLPTTYIINPEGQIVKKVVGALTEADLLATLQELHAVL